jgi:hypothetical protein
MSVEEGKRWPREESEEMCIYDGVGGSGIAVQRRLTYTGGRWEERKRGRG